MRGILLGVATAALSTTASAKTFKLDVNPTGEEQSARMDSGRQAIYSHQAHSAVMFVEPSEPTEPHGAFRIVILNSSDKPVNFGPENIRLRYGDGQSMKMFSYATLKAAEERRTKSQQFWAAVGGLGRSLQAVEAGQYQGSGNVYSGWTGNQVASFDYSGTNYGAQYAATQHAQAANAADQMAIEAGHMARVGALDELMQTTTVDPGKSFGGMVSYGFPIPMKRVKTAYPVTLEVTIGEEVHRFVGTLQHR